MKNRTSATARRACAILFAIAVLVCRGDSATAQVEWERTFGGAGAEWARSVQPTSDGGYILAGQTDSYGAGEKDVYLVKTDAGGNMQWEKTFGGPDNDWAFAVTHTSDGGYAVGGVTWSFGAGENDFYFIKTDAQGQVEWERTYGGVGADDCSR